MFVAMYISVHYGTDFLRKSIFKETKPLYTAITNIITVRHIVSAKVIIMKRANTLVKTEIDGYDVEIIIAIPQTISMIEFNGEYRAYIADVDLADVIRAVLTAVDLNDLLVMVKNTWKYESLKSIVESLEC